MNNYVIETKRLGFRLWLEQDNEPFAKMNSNIDVMRYFPSILLESESETFREKINYHFEKYGYGLWAVELKKTKEFIGFIGLQNTTFESSFTPCIEIGWRLDKKFWNKGFATEGAERCLEYAFKSLNISKIFSFTAKLNIPSENIMKKIGMIKQLEFDHPKLNRNHALSKHVLYKIENV